ncbi:uncharacterized protein LOC134259188 [Saccostrea cucullata]|uniref:uncharacterized protein LOC134259188 n=1 Tax=Saccostrea cuccullata TaxID=36930 RepID=UPI002ED35BAA
MGFSIIRLLLAALLLVFIGAVCGTQPKETSLAKRSSRNRLLENLILTYLRNIQMPQISGSSGSVRYRVNNLRITDLTLPRSSVQKLQGSPLTLKLTVDGGRIGGKLDFWFRYKTWLLQHTDDGYVNFGASRIGFKVKVTADLASKTLQVNSCSSPRSSVRIKFHGTGWGWLYNRFRGRLENSLEKKLSGSNGLICKGVTRAINRGGKIIFNKLVESQG